MSNGDSCGFAQSFTESTSHTLLESICTSTREHLVDSNNMPWVDSDSHVEVFSTGVGGHVLVASNSSGLESLRGDLLLFVTDQMDASGEFFKLGSFISDVINSQFRVWYTSIESRFWIWFVLTVTIALGWSTSHCFCQVPCVPQLNSTSEIGRAHV